jgi:hypothetical protein
LFDLYTYRSVAGIINFSVAKLDNSLLAFPTAVHELLHALGFVDDVFTTLRGPDFAELPRGEGYQLVCRGQRHATVTERDAIG